jgi:hypothetical protein
MNSILTGIGMAFGSVASVVQFIDNQSELDAVSQKISLNGF